MERNKNIVLLFKRSGGNMEKTLSQILCGVLRQTSHSSWSKLTIFPVLSIKLITFIKITPV